MRRVVLALFVLALPALAAGQTAPPSQNPPPARREVRAIPITSAITIDGVLDEAVWATAAPCTAFVQRDPVEGARPTQRTEVRILFDRDALYIGARMYDSAPDSIVSELSRRDGGTRSDRFTVYLDPYHDRRSGCYFGINAAGTCFDGTLYNDGWSDDSWDGVWEARSKRDAQGWTAEMRVPYSQLRFAKADPQAWGINFCRQMGRGFEDIYFENRPKKSSGFVSLFPTLVGLQDVNPTNAIEIIPYATSKAEFLQHETGDPFHDGSSFKPNAGGDLRMPFGSKLTLNATVNPDFGQVEVDPAVVNLSDVETFFPEKRPFFVEGSSIFDAGQQGASDYWGFNYPQPTFFYTRRIGHAPDGSVPDDAMFTDEPAGTTILGAAKLSGKLSPSMNFGMLHAVTSKEEAKLQYSDLSQGEVEVEPLTYYGVARMLKEFPERRHGLGALATYALRDLDGSVLADQLNRTAAAGIVDGWHFVDSKKVWVLSGWAGGSLVQGTAARITDVQTSSRHYFQRPDAESFSVDPNATSLTGTGARVWLNKEKGNWLSNSAIGYLSPGFEVNDLGFMSRADLVNSHLGIGYKWTEPTKQVKNHNWFAAVFASNDFDGNRTSEGVWTRGFWWFTNNWTFQSSFAFNPETINPRRSRGGPLMLNKPGYEVNLFGDTDGSRKRYYNVNYYQYLQPEENSWVYQVNPFFTFKPKPNLRLEIGPGYESDRDGSFYVATIADPTAVATYGSRYVFARLDQRTVSANIRLNVSFTPTMSLQFYGQPLISSGRYSDFKELARPKSLDFVGQGAGAWTYDPTTREFDPDGAGPEEAEVKDFNTKSLRGNAVFRWEYMPGSTLFLVWTQQRNDTESIPTFDIGPSFTRLMATDADNIFLAKVTYYLNR
jgi:Domain of unknown function (DUF5916)/Carbohydrate family 9 binding domain-like